jgi:hypothetical protein
VNSVHSGCYSRIAVDLFGLWMPAEQCRVAPASAQGLTVGEKNQRRDLYASEEKTEGKFESGNGIPTRADCCGCARRDSLPAVENKNAA